MEKKAIIIGCSTGIGRALAQKLSREGYFVGLTGRDSEKLRSLQAELSGKSQVQRIDVRESGEAILQLHDLITRMGGMDLLILNAGVLCPNPELDWTLEEETGKVNVMGFMAMADTAVNYFLKQGSGTLVAISSVAGHRGSGYSPAYSASKAFIINYMEGLRQKLCKTPIMAIDIRPGFVDTPMIRGRKGLFGVIPSEKAADDIFQAIQKRKDVAYVPWWWAVLAWIFDRIPEFIYHQSYRKYRTWSGKAQP